MGLLNSCYYLTIGIISIILLNYMEPKLNRFSYYKKSEYKKFFYISIPILILFVISLIF